VCLFSQVNAAIATKKGRAHGLRCYHHVPKLKDTMILLSLGNKHFLRNLASQNVKLQLLFLNTYTVSKSHSLAFLMPYRYAGTHPTLVDNSKQTGFENLKFDIYFDLPKSDISLHIKFSCSENSFLRWCFCQKIFFLEGRESGQLSGASGRKGNFRSFSKHFWMNGSTPDGQPK